MAFKAASDAMTTALITRGVYLFATDTSKPIASISERGGSTELQLIALSSDCDQGYDR